MMKKLLSLILLMSLVSCGSTPKIEEEIEKNEDRELTKDYVLMNASDKALPTWIKVPSQGDYAKKRSSNRYFVNEAMNSNKRFCVSTAQKRARTFIAEEIATFIKNSYANAMQGGGDEEVSEYIQEQLAAEAQAFVIGSSVLKSYWEKRNYLKKLGADQNEKKYNCFALVKMSKDNLEHAIKKSRAKLLNNISNPEVKQKTEKALKMVEKKFSDADA